MKARSLFVAVLTIFAGSAALSADMAGMNMDKPAVPATQKPQAHRAVGVVKAVDAAKGTITLSHDPVPSIKWPAMTMAFKASKDQITGVKAGDRVNFEFTAKGMDATVTSIKKAR
jgi:Cu(I)/Ag(I) efflux system protein CusF